MNYQWYPGHMTKAVRMMQEDIKLIDLVIELLDARIPFSSRNPDIDRLAAGKYRLVLLNKSDLADPGANQQWVRYFSEQGAAALLVDARSGTGVNAIENLAQTVCREKLERDRRRGIVNRPIRAMVAGIPNVGKSTLINALAGRACTRTGNKPGVTKGKQWIRVGRTLELLDTPGILWPKFEDQTVGMRLALIGSMNDEILSAEELALDLAGELSRLYPGSVEKRYGLTGEAKGHELLAGIAMARCVLGRGGEPDLPRAAAALTEDFRSGKLGRMTLERPVNEHREVM